MECDINIKLEIERLLNFAIEKYLIVPEDLHLIRNRMLGLFNLDAPYEGDEPSVAFKDVDEALNNILTYCYLKKILPDSTITKRDLLSSKIMGCITPRPTEITKRFNKLYQKSPMEATDYLYNLCRDVDYIKTSREKKNVYFDHEEDYGRIECSVNFSRHEKTAAEIEEEQNSPETNYPKCLLCEENVGFYGNLRMPAKQNLRVIPHNLGGQEWFLQYSPYTYYNEHCLVINKKHTPLKIRERTFSDLLEFVEQYPHYFLGVNADLPMLGDSLAEHEHYQGGCNMFPIEYAETLQTFTHPSFKSVNVHMLKWPVSTIRAECGDPEYLARCVNFIKNFWKNYTDEDANIHAFTEHNGKQVPHNTIACVARKNIKGNFEMDVILRNNATDEQHPHGIFQPRESLHHIKSDQIGLIECLGLVVFRGSYDYEILHIMSHLMTGKHYEKGGKPELDKHEQWINHLVDKYKIITTYETAKQVMYFETARKFAKILDDCGIFKLTDDGIEKFTHFIRSLGFKPTDTDNY